MTKRLKISFGLRLCLFFFLLIGIGLTLQLNTLMNELKPGLRQATEETLVDSANLLAEIATRDFVNGELENGNFHHAFRRFQQRQINAQIWSKEKTESLLRLYITNDQGIVVYHTDPSELGKDYSRWNDVYWTLNGEYGARSTLADPADPTSTEMYVAAPIQVGDNVIGVLTLIKPNLSLQPFLDVSQYNVKRFGIGLIIVALLLGAILSFWLTRSIRQLSHYATTVSRGESAVALPEFSDIELDNLAKAMATMREELEGKHYVENYIHSLTHEMKSPVAAIKGASEILEHPIPEQDRQHFITNIQNESARLETLINQLLALAALENKQSLGKRKTIKLSHLVHQLTKHLSIPLNQKKLQFTVAGDAIINADPFLLSQAIENLLTNAIEFSPIEGEITVNILQHQGQVSVQVTDQGPGIPDYAKDRIFERFYSLPRPLTGKKSSGLGLSFVKQICFLHQGRCDIKNGRQGAIATLNLPTKANQKHT
ncbi:two-component system sensor histidine kinase CreC [Thaumasiovibrio subtropicus]|uniref:two-component system sensor histidine kinase CreC n=1 Tax=Thaumasiovibrio subtropicus TaxID=1891207 RepID=UPI000B35DA90|nr:two-component system sensor histidine kinase CreC [Thaumasiovibrio subtropicus]